MNNGRSETRTQPWYPINDPNSEDAGRGEGTRALRLEVMTARPAWSTRPFKTMSQSCVPTSFTMLNFEIILGDALVPMGINALEDVKFWTSNATAYAQLRTSNVSDHPST